MKRFFVVCVLVICFSLLFSVSVFGGDSLMEDLMESADLARLAEVLPADLPMREELLADLGSEEGFSSDTYFASLLTAFWPSLRECVLGEVGLFASLFSVLLCSAFFSAMRQAWFRDSVGDVVDFLSVLVLSGVSFYALHSLFLSARDVLVVFSEFLSGMLPITGAVYSLSGGVGTAAVQHTLFQSALSVLDAICTYYLVPLLSASFALSAANAVGGINFSALSRFLRRCVSFSLGAVYLTLLIVLSVQTVLSAASDSLGLRTARFAASNFIPAVGGMFSESAKTVFAAVGVLRTSLGAVGILCILWILLSPMLTLLCRKVLFLLLSALADAFSLEREGRFLSECAETIGLLSAVLFSSGVFFLLGFALFLSVPIGG